MKKAKDFTDFHEFLLNSFEEKIIHVNPCYPWQKQNMAKSNSKQKNNLRQQAGINSTVFFNSVF